MCIRDRYRAMAYYLLKNHVSGENSKEIEEKCQDAEISICYENGEQQVLLGEENVTCLLYTSQDILALCVYLRITGNGGL